LADDWPTPVNADKERQVAAFAADLRAKLPVVKKQLKASFWW